MDRAAETPSPFVTAAQLAGLAHKPVVLAGKVKSATPAALVLEAAGGGAVSVARAQPVLSVVDVGATVLLRGVVAADGSVTESSDFAAHDVGDKFGKLPCVPFRGRPCMSAAPCSPLRCLRVLSASSAYSESLAGRSPLTVLLSFLPLLRPDLNLFKEAAAVTSNAQFVHMFNN